MSFDSPAFMIPRRSIAGEEAEWVKMFDPPEASLATPEFVPPTNPVPEIMLAAGFQNQVSVPHTVQRRLLHSMRQVTWDGLKAMEFFVFTDQDNPATVAGNFPAATIRLPRGVVFHGETSGSKGPHTIHWHGIEPTPVNDGVGHCSMEIGQYSYQWQPNFIGTYFYHCHRNTVQHFEFGLYGMIIVEPPDAYFATLENPAIPIGHCRDGLRRTAANTSRFRQFPGFNGNLLTSGDPHAHTIPYDVEALWVLDDRDSVWSDLAPNHAQTFPAHGLTPGVDDVFDTDRTSFAAFNDYHADYFYCTGVPFLGYRGDPGAALHDPSLAFGTLDRTVPPALNSGVSGMQVAVNARVGQTILIRCLNAAYAKMRVRFPVDVVVIAWDGRALGVPPFGYNSAYLVRAGEPIDFSTARRFDALIRATQPIDSFANAEFSETRGGDHIITGRIPFRIS